MAHHDNTQATPAAIENSQTMWHRFMFAVKYSTIAVAVLLLLLAAVLL